MSEIELRRELGIEGVLGMIAPLALAISFFFATRFCAFSVSAVAYVVFAVVLAGFHVVINERKKPNCVR